MKASTSKDLLVTENRLPVQNIDQEQRHLRFSGVGRLYTSESTTNKEQKAVTSSQLAPHLETIERLAAATVTVVGLGGVGSWAAEALCRSGIGNIVLIDLDDICISNTNRQLHATSSTVGQLKLDEMERRLSDINPQCNITLIHDFISKENVNAILDSCGNTTGVLDAMDGMIEKTALLAACVERRIPIVTCAGAAGRKDPTKIVVEDLVRVEYDRLLASCRKSLRKSYNFERGLSPIEARRPGRRQRKWGIQAVYSTEAPKSICSGDNTSPLRRCDGPMGTACFVTGTFGFVAASRMVEMIANDKLVKPRKQPRRLTAGEK